MSAMPRQVPVVPNKVNDGHKLLHEGLVPAVEVGLQKVLEVRCLLDSAKHLRTGDKLLTQHWPIKRHHREDDSVEDKVLELHDLRSCERWHDIEEQCGRLLPAARGHEVDALIHLQLVAPLPVASLAELNLGAVDLLLGELRVVKEEGNADNREDVVQLPAHAHGLVVCVLVGLDGGLLVTYSVVELRLCQQGIADLHVTQVLLRVLDLFLKLCQSFLVFGLHLSLQGLVGRAEG
mmetsp:Transcript_83032/g.220283  ORF Transcript_83032/g.220283 Transcript_83032/m.220283 type:complete len:235 (+) Transcript_83032:396-1100(+)